MATRFSRQQWVELGLHALGQDGPAAITVEAICNRANRTKGSFYHHFDDHDAYLQAMVDHWTEQNLMQPIRQSESGNANQRLKQLNDLAARLDPAIEIGMRNLAARQAVVNDGVRALDEKRIAYLISLYKARGMNAAAAKTAARIQYAGYVGAQMLWPSDFQKMVTDLGLAVDDLLENNSKPISRRRATKRKR